MTLYERKLNMANALCSALRAFGYDVKHDMQGNKLIWYGDLIE